MPHETAGKLGSREAAFHLGHSPGEREITADDGSTALTNQSERGHLEMYTLIM